MQVKLKRVTKSDVDKNGIKLVSKKDGKPYFKIGIQIEGSDEWINGFANNTNDPRYNMEEGGTYSLAITENEVAGKVYKNFRMLTPEEKKMEEMEAELAQLRKGSQPAPGTFEPTNTVEAQTTEQDLDTF